MYVLGWGERRETHSTADNWGGPWTKATEALHGEHGYEMYSLVPYRSPTWRAGLYLGIGSFFETTNPEGYVRCELCRSTDYGMRIDYVVQYARGDSRTCSRRSTLLRGWG